jgi:hypothetical protein
MNRKNSNTFEKARSIFLIISATAMILTFILILTIGFHFAVGIAFGVQSLFSFLYGITDDSDMFSCGL